MPAEDGHDLQPLEPAIPLLFRSMDAAAAPVVAAAPVLAVPPPVDLPAVTATAHADGVREGRRQGEAELAARLDAERQGVAQALENFIREKQRYFAGLEKEVVRLSLAIAERVLHREASMDPALLAGAARVALDEVKDDRDAVLHVAAADLPGWTAQLADAGRAVELRPDPALSRGECVLQTPSGSVELGIRAQLQEIERGFFELLGRNPAAAL